MWDPIRIVVVLLGLGLAGQATAQDCNGNGVEDADELEASFRGLGDLPGGDFHSWANAVSADGSVVVGASVTGSGREAFRWTRGGGMVGLGYLPGDAFSEASDVSADGAAIVGLVGLTALTVQPFRWIALAGMEGLGHLRFSSTPPTVSADGSVVVGGDCYFSFLTAGLCEAFRWTPAEGMVGLGDLPDGQFDSQATGVSADGMIVVGNGDIGGSPCDCLDVPCSVYDLFRWTVDTGMMGLGFLPVTCGGSWATGVSADGSALIGRSGDPPFEAFRWTAADGRVGLGDLPGGAFSSEAGGASGDGSVVVGTSESAFGSEAFLWDAGNGMRSLRVVLSEEYGVDLTGWTLMSARDISDDGRTIVGYGINPDGFGEAWMATLPLSTDCNANGVPDPCDQDCNANHVADECEMWVTAPVDIRPGACPNVLSRAGRGELTVALLGTDEFDVSDVDLSSVRVRREGCVGASTIPDVARRGLSAAVEDIGTPHDDSTCSCHDRRVDGQADLVMRFRADDIVAQLQLNDDPGGALVELVVTGELNDGTPFIGSDCVLLAPPVPSFGKSKLKHLGSNDHHDE